MKVGDLAVVQDSVWQAWCEKHLVPYHPFHPQPIAAMPANPPFQGSVQLGFPLWWWNENEIRIVSEGL